MTRDDINKSEEELKGYGEKMILARVRDDRRNWVEISCLGWRGTEQRAVLRVDDLIFFPSW